MHNDDNRKTQTNQRGANSLGKSEGRECDVFTHKPLQDWQLDCLEGLRRKFRRFPRNIWIGSYEGGAVRRYEQLLCLKVAMGNGHYVALCHVDGRDSWYSIKHDEVSVRLTNPMGRK